jgi:aminobenzoyl-glutamate utilization protein B
VTNHALADAVWRNLEAVGAPVLGDDAVGVAREIQRKLGMQPMDQPFLEACLETLAPQEAERRMREHLPAWQRNWTSDDYVEMSWYAPTARFYIARPTLAPPPGASYPSWVANALGGIPATIDPTVVCAAKTIAGTMLDLFRSPDTLAQARREFDERTAGSPHRDALLPRSFEPPLDLPWPEYVTTARGTGWMNPYG